MKRFVIVGLGNFGTTVARALGRTRNEVVAIDIDEGAVDRIAKAVERAVVGDGRDRNVLEQLGAEGSDVAIVSTGDDITASVLSTMSLKDLGVKEIYVKVISPEHARVMDKLGVTQTIFPERDSAVRLAHQVLNTAILNYVQISGDFSVQEMAVPEEWIGKSLRELELPKQYRISVIALHDFLRDEMVPIPDADARLKDSDTLVVAGRDEDLTRAAGRDRG